MLETYVISILSHDLHEFFAGEEESPYIDLGGPQSLSLTFRPAALEAELNSSVHQPTP